MAARKVPAQSKKNLFNVNYLPSHSERILTKQLAIVGKIGRLSVFFSLVSKPNQRKKVVNCCKYEFLFELLKTGSKMELKAREFPVFYQVTPRNSVPKIRQLDPIETNSSWHADCLLE